MSERTEREVRPDETGDPSTVLIVDDDPDVAETTKRYAEADHDVEAVVVTDPDEALSIVDEGDVDCVVSDYRLAGTTGLELLEAVRSSYPDLPFILFTRHGNEDVASQAISTGVTDYLQKGDDEQFALLANRIGNAIERLESERELRAEKERFQRLVQEVEEYAIFLLDESGHIVTWNDGARRVKGYSEEEVLGEHLSLFYPEGKKARADRLIARAREQGSVQDEGWRVRKDGSKFWANATLTATYDRSGELLGFSKVTRDMTARREYERKLERKNDRLERVMSVLNHDLRTPLNTAQARLEIGRERDDPEHFAVASDALDRIEQLLDRLMLFAGKGRVVSEPESVDLGDVVAGAVRTVNDDLDVEIDGELPSVDGDAKRLQELVENLLKNVDDHVGPTARVTVGPLDGGFYVADDGEGMPDVDRKRAFDADYTTEEDGTGVGLSIVREIAEAHGWEVAITESDAGGARFEFRP